MTIIDTSVILAAVERRSAAVRDVLRNMTERSRRSFIVTGELAFGVHTADSADTRHRRERSLRYYRMISRPVGAIDLDELSRWFGVASGIAQAAGIRIGQNDRWIICEALHADVPLWTADETMHELCKMVAADPQGRNITSRLLPAD